MKRSFEVKNKDISMSTISNILIDRNRKQMILRVINLLNLFFFKYGINLIYYLSINLINEYKNKKSTIYKIANQKVYKLK